MYHVPWRALVARVAKFWRPARRVACILLIPYLLVIGGMMRFEESLEFFPSRYPDGIWQPAGLKFEDAWFEACDGTKLHGWYVPCENAKAAVLFSHGNGGNLTHRDDVLRALHARVHGSVLIFDYRGYGRSQGKPSESGILADARAARAWLAAREKLDPRELVMMGESLGGAVAVDLAAKEGARALVLQCTFSSLPDVAAYHYPWIPVRWLMRTRLDSRRKIGQYHGPLLQVHGDADSIVPIQFARRLFEAANEPKQFLVLHGHDHNDILPNEYFDALAKFLAELRAAQP